MMKKLIIPFFGLCVAMLAACNEDSASTTVAPVETIIDTTYVEVVETIFDTVVRDSADTVIIRKYNDIVKRDTFLMAPECTIDENDSSITISCGDKTTTQNKYKCGAKSYNPLKEFCYMGGIWNLCGDYSYNPQKYFCHEDSLMALCNGDSYDPTTQYCQKGEIAPLCNGHAYDPDTYFCNGDSPIALCNGKKYDPSSQFCQGNGLFDLCGGSKYDPETQFCFENSPVTLCNGKSYYPTTQFCRNDKIYDLCGKQPYNVDTYFCYKDSLIALCNGKPYDPLTENCHKNIVYEHGFFTDERDGKTYKYVVIGNQTWMAENLNYNYQVPTSQLDSSSFCHSHKPDSCLKYGRLYLWSAAMDSAGLFSTDGLGCGTGSKCNRAETVRGVCPEGWHLPEKEEWDTLFTQHSYDFGKCDFKTSRECFYKIGVDLMDSNLLSMTGGGFYDTYTGGLGSHAYFGSIPYVDLWTSTQGKDQSYTYAIFMVFITTDNTEEPVYFQTHWTSVARPVRCIKDEPF